MNQHIDIPSLYMYSDYLTALPDTHFKILTQLSRISKDLNILPQQDAVGTFRMLLYNLYFMA